jgi:hypothetical protein
LQRFTQKGHWKHWMRVQHLFLLSWIRIKHYLNFIISFQYSNNSYVSVSVSSHLIQESVEGFWLGALRVRLTYSCHICALLVRVKSGLCKTHFLLS